MPASAYFLPAPLQPPETINWRHVYSSGEVINKEVQKLADHVGSRLVQISCAIVFLCSVSTKRRITLFNVTDIMSAWFKVNLSLLLTYFEYYLSL